MNIREISNILAISIPLMAAFLAQKGMQFVDTFMMGWIGPDALAAGALSTSLFITMMCFCMGCLSAVGIFIVRARGAEYEEDISHTLLHGILFVFLLCVPCTLLLWFISPLLLKIGITVSIVQQSTAFLHGLVWGFPGLLLFLVFREFVSAFSLTRVIMLVCILSIPLTIAFNFIFIYGKFGLPRLGVAGIGYASAIVMWFMFFCLFFYSKKQTQLKKYLKVLFHSSFDYQKILALFKLGSPSGLILMLDMGMFSCAAILLGQFGVVALAAYQIAFQCVSLSYALPFGLGMATALQVGHAAAAHHVLLAKRYAFIGLGLGLVISGVLALFFIFMPEQLARFFLKPSDIHHDEIIQLVTLFLIGGALFQCFDAAQTIMNGALRGLKDTFIPMLICLFCYWILGMGSAVFLAFYTPIGAPGVWYGLTIGIFAAGVLLTLRFLRKSAHLAPTALSQTNRPTGHAE